MRRLSGDMHTWERSGLARADGRSVERDWIFALNESNEEARAY